MLVHSSLEIGLTGFISAVAFTGQRGVQLFFVVSAFTLFLSHDNRKNEHHPTFNFFLRRLFRLFPMFYIATAIACILTPIYAGPRTDVILSLLFLHGFAPRPIIHGAVGGWTVATEAVFYMSLPLLFSKVNTLKRSLWILFLSAPILYLATQATVHLVSPDTFEYLTFFGYPVEFPVFIMGIATYYFWKAHIAVKDGLHGSKDLSLLILAAAAAIYFVDLPFTNRNLYFTSLACVLLLIALSIYPWPILVNRVTRLLGKISFSIYLLHIYFLLEFRQLLSRSPVLSSHPVLEFAAIFIATLAATIPASYLTWRWIETPGIRLGKRLINYLERQSSRKSVQTLNC